MPPSSDEFLDPSSKSARSLKEYLGVRAKKSKRSAPGQHPSRDMSRRIIEAMRPYFERRHRQLRLQYGWPPMTQEEHDFLIQENINDIFRDSGFLPSDK